MAKSILTPELLRERVHYDPETGLFTWRISHKRARAGELIGTTDGSYLKGQIGGTLYSLHRLAWFYVHGTWPVGVIDHKDGDGFNNRIDNLRDVPDMVNSQNRQGANTNSKSGVLGVRWHKRDQVWIAEIKLPGARRQTHLGTFKTIEAASEAYLVAKRAHHEGCTI